MPSTIVAATAHWSRAAKLCAGGRAPGPPPAEWLQSGYMRTADTIEGLAERCGLEGAHLRATVDRFNAAVQALSRASKGNSRGGTRLATPALMVT